ILVAFIRKATPSLAALLFRAVIIFHAYAFPVQAPKSHGVGIVHEITAVKGKATAVLIANSSIASLSVTAVRSLITISLYANPHRHANHQWRVITIAIMFTGLRPAAYPLGIFTSTSVAVKTR